MLVRSIADKSHADQARRIWTIPDGSSAARQRSAARHWTVELRIKCGSGGPGDWTALRRQSAESGAGAPARTSGPHPLAGRAPRAGSTWAARR